MDSPDVSITNINTAYGGALLSVKKVGQLLGVSRSTVYRLIESGDLERWHIGRRALITGNSVVAYWNRLGGFNDRATRDGVLTDDDMELVRKVQRQAHEFNSEIDRIRYDQ